MLNNVYIMFPIIYFMIKSSKVFSLYLARYASISIDKLSLGNRLLSVQNIQGFK